MARKAIVDKDKILSLLKEGETTQSIAERFGVSRQAIDLHRREFISQGLLPDQRAARAGRARREEVKTAEVRGEEGRGVDKSSSLDEQIDLIIAAFMAMKRLPQLEKELEGYKRKCEDATKEIELLREAEHRRQDQEIRWLTLQREKDQNTPP